MPAAAVAAPLLLTLVLALSGVAKLRDPVASGRAFDDLHVPDALAGPLITRGLPWVELALAALLLLGPPPLNTAAAVAVLALMASYLVLVAAALRRPEPVDCHCFGTLAGGRVTRLTLARNGVLVALALVAIADSLTGTPLVRLRDPEVAGWLAAVVAAGWLGHAVLGERPDASPAPATPTGAGEPATSEPLDYVRTPIPHGTLLDDGRPVSLRGLARDRAMLLVWVSLSCGACEQVIRQLPAWREALGPVEVRPVLSAPAGEAARPELSGALWDPEHTVQHLLGFVADPMAVLLGADGELAGGPVVGDPDVSDLVAQIAEQLAEAAATGERAGAGGEQP